MTDRATKKMKIVFMGTPKFAVNSLCALSLHREHEVVAVVSQPDREKDKKGNIIITPVKEKAIELGIPVYQYDKVSVEGVDTLKKLQPDLFVTAAFGQLLSKEILDIPRLGTLNVHASILPKYRGSSPIQTAILNGETETGITIMRTELGMDSGDILSSRVMKLLGNETSGEAQNRLSELGANLLIETLSHLLDGSIKPQKQDDEKATYCKKILKENAKIDWNKPCEQVNNLIRAMNPAIIAYTVINDKTLKIYSAKPLENISGKSGEVMVSDSKNGLVIACKTGALSLEVVQVAGKKVMNILEFMRGFKLDKGVVIQ